jgi:hypothetical protein
MSFRLIDPDEKLDFTVDFSSWLDTGVLITGTPAWTISPTGPTIGDQTNTTTAASIFVSGATLGVVYLLSCKITTDAAVAQTAERSITIRCETR